MLIAEDLLLLLLLTDDRTGKLVAPSNQVDVALGGALLIELALAQRVEITAESGTVRKGRLIVTDTSPTSDGLLDEALTKLAARQGKKPKDVVAALGKGLRGRLQTRLAEGGLLREESGKMLGIFPSHHWPATDAAHENSVRVALIDALRAGATDGDRVGALISLLHALKRVEKVVDPNTVGVTKRELKANAKQIAEGNWASEAVRGAIDQMIAAMAAATSSSAAAAGGA
jgi:Golgi phosphoprotein 3 (GPP34)